MLLERIEIDEGRAVRSSRASARFWDCAGRVPQKGGIWGVDDDSSPGDCAHTASRWPSSPAIESRAGASGRDAPGRKVVTADPRAQ